MTKTKERTIVADSPELLQTEWMKHYGAKGWEKAPIRICWSWRRWRYVVKYSVKLK